MMKTNRTWLSCLGLLVSLFCAQAQQTISCLDKNNFAKYWLVESESPDYQIRHLNDTLEIVSPKGLTLWRKDKMQGNVVIEYDACVMDEGQPGDRLSDLKCIWMASDPKHPNKWTKRMTLRSAISLKG